MKSREDYSNLGLDELKERLSERVEELENLRLQQATHQISNPLRIRYVRRDIARLKTLIHQQAKSQKES